jgi:cell division topological specificity factor
MNNFLDRVLGKDRRTAHQAKERLKLVLIHDRTDLTPSKMDKLKDELIEVISRYVDIDASAVRIDMTQDGREQRLLADIPLRPAVRKRSR